MRTRNTRTLDCGHTFHVGCINKWKSQGNYSCPICRQEFDPPEYRVRIFVEYVGNGNQPGASIDASRHTAETIGRSVITADMLFDVDDIDMMREALQSVGAQEADITLLERELQSASGAQPGPSPS